MSPLACVTIRVGALSSEVCLERQRTDPPRNYEACEAVTRPGRVGENERDSDHEDDKREDERCSHGGKGSAESPLVNGGFA